MRFVTSSLAITVSLIALTSLTSGCSEEEDPARSAVVYVAAGTQETTAIAAFYGDRFGETRCASGTLDHCVITNCLDGGPVQTYIDGGKVDFEGDELEATVNTGNVEDENGETGPGLASVRHLPALSDNETITMTIRGKGNVSTVEGSIKMPRRLELTEPELSEPSCQAVDPDDVEPIAIDTGDDFALSWTSDEDDDIDVLFFFDDIKDYEGDEDRERYTTIRCLYSGEDGGAVIPEEVVSYMPPGPGSFTIRQISRNAKLVGNWAITFGGYWELCSPVDVQ